MQTLLGPAAFTPFQLNRVREAAGLRSFHSAEVFFVDAKGALSEEDRKGLSTLLQESEAPVGRPPDFVVIPRFGTISPWSSKAIEQ